MYKIAIISGDGIGKEVMESGKYLLEHLNINFSLKPAHAGYDCFKKTGTTLPQESIKIAKKSDATLFGAITSTPGEQSPIINLRKELKAYANLRPIKSYVGVNSLHENIDFLIVRENTEGMYSQIEYEEDGKFIAERIITKKASEKISEIAFKQCISRNMKKVTCVHKSNVLKKTDGIFKESFYKIANKYPEIKANDYYIDATAMYLITNPQFFDVIVTTNLFGDILSDEGAGLVGGLGLAPSGNIGDKHGLFEPVHGSAPDIAGKNICNPVSMILSVAMMLEYLGENYYSEKIKNAVEIVLKKGKTTTPDLGGKSKTMEMTEAIINTLNDGGI